MPAKKAKKQPQKPRRPRKPNYSEDEKAASLEAVIACDGNVAEASRILGIAQVTLRCWTLGQNVSSAVYDDYKANARARVQERVEAFHATRDEVLSLYALHLRCDVADFEGIIGTDGSLDLAKAKARNVSRLVRKVRTVPTKLGNIREIEFYSSKDAADSLAAILGLNKQAAANPDTEERRRVFWRSQIEAAMEKFNLDEGKAREWLLQNVPAARAEQDWLM